MRCVGKVAIGALALVWIAALSPNADAESLKEARSKFTTVAKPTDYKPDPSAKPSVYKAYSLIKYPSPAGQLSAYVSADPVDGQKHPAVVWAHGGFGGVDVSELAPRPASNDQSPDPMRAAGFVVMYPSWRGENDNPGRFELYYGEVDDLIAAVAYAKSLPYVDPRRVYLIGHSSGGTLVLLAVEMGVDVRAAVSFGGNAGIGDEVKLRHGAFYQYRSVPFAWTNPAELRLRSPGEFVPDIHTPTLYVEGARVTGNATGAAAMRTQAQTSGTPLDVHLIEGGDHFDILRPMKRLVAQRLLTDTGEGPFAVKFTDDELQQAYLEFKGAQPQTPDQPFAKLSPEAAAYWHAQIDPAQQKLPRVPLFLRPMLDADGRIFIQVQRTYDVGDVQCESEGVRVVMDPQAYQALAPLRIEMKTVNGQEKPWFVRKAKIN